MAEKRKKLKTVTAIKSKTQARRSSPQKTQKRADTMPSYGELNSTRRTNLTDMRVRGKTQPGMLFPSEPAAEEPREKYSIMMTPALARAVRVRAREMGLSFNAYISMSCYFTLRNVDPFHPPPSSTPSQTGPTLVIQQPAPKPELTPDEALQKKLDKFGPGYTAPAEAPGEPRPFVSWDKLEDYIQAMQDHPGMQWHDLGRMMGLTTEEARAADIGSESPEYRRYATVKYGPEPSTPPKAARR